MNREVIQYVDIEMISVMSQIRDALEGEQPTGLAKSMRAIGLQQPVRLCRDGVRLAIVDGERRYWAARLLGWNQIPAIIEERELCEAEVIQRQLIANCHRKAVKPAEFGQAIEELIAATGWKLEEVSAMTGFSVAMLSKHRPLGTLPPVIREQVDAGAIPADSAYHLSRLEDPAQQQALAAAVVQDGLTRDEVCAQVQALRNGAAPSGPRQRSRFKVVLDQVAVTITGSELSPSRIEVLLSELRRRARTAIARGCEGDAFWAALREPSVATRAGSSGTLMPRPRNESA